MLNRPYQGIPLPSQTPMPGRPEGQFKLHFGEVEHSGDLARCISAVEAAGGQVLKSGTDYDNETAVLLVAHPNRSHLLQRMADAGNAACCEEVDDFGRPANPDGWSAFRDK